MPTLPKVVLDPTQACAVLETLMPTLPKVVLAGHHFWLEHDLTEYSLGSSGRVVSDLCPATVLSAGGDGRRSKERPRQCH